MSARRVGLVGCVLWLCAVVGVLVFASAPALAAAPEAPETLAVSGVKNTTAVLHGVLNPHAKALDGWYFSYSSGAACTGAGAVATRLEAPAEVQAEAVEVPVQGLLPGTEYKACLVASNEASETTVGNQVVFAATDVAPVVGGESFSTVGSSGVTLVAQVDPEGIPTSFFFEYGSSIAYGSVSPVQSVGGGSESVGVRSAVEGLQPDTVYHFRVVAKNAQGMVSDGGDQSFSTFPVGLLGLPDGRGYELVSSLGSADVTVLPFHTPVRAAADGSGVVYTGTAPPVGGNGNGLIFGNPEYGQITVEHGSNTYFAERSGVGGWVAADIQPGGFSSANYQSFSNDLSVGVLGSTDAVTGNAPGKGYDVLYSRSASDGAYSPLFTKAPSPSHFVEAREFGVGYAGASSDTTHQLFSANEALLENGSPQAGALNAIVEKEFAGGRKPNVLYDSVGGVVSLVSVLPDGQVDAQASFGSGQGPIASADGSRVFWSTMKPVEEAGVTRPAALYVREHDSQPQSPLGPGGECTVPGDACTVQVDASHVLGGEGGGGVFWSASNDGSRVFFTDEKRLTNGSTAAAGAPDLYEYNVQNGILTDLSVDGNLGEHADVVGVLGVSETGSYVYFAAAGALASGAKPQECVNENSKCNVYVVREGESPKFVAAVTQGDGKGKGNFFATAIPGFVGGDWVTRVGDRSAYVTPDGRHLVFESIENLTGFDNGGGEEIYMYDVGSGLSCVSCNPTGTPTISNRGPYSHHVELAESLSPEYASQESPGYAGYALRDLSVDGNRVFFDSREALVPQDTNGKTDVYEWERDGSGSCEREKGCLYLLSGGTSSDFSLFVDASESGDDVFIETRAQLVPRDRGEVFEVYDVRVGAPQEPSAPECTGSGCQGVPGASPIFATPSSVTFDGVGNFPPPTQTVVKAKPKTAAKCKKSFVRKKGRCVKQRGKRSGGAASAGRRGKRSIGGSGR